MLIWRQGDMETSRHQAEYGKRKPERFSLIHLLLAQ
jgi:hypothetical protein